MSLYVHIKKQLSSHFFFGMMHSTPRCCLGFVLNDFVCCLAFFFVCIQSTLIHMAFSLIDAAINCLLVVFA